IKVTRYVTIVQGTKSITFDQEMKNKLSTYINTYKQQFEVKGPYFTHYPEQDLCLSIVVPSFKEPNILPTLDSLKNCRPPGGSVEVIVVINAPENSPKQVLL